MVVEFGDMLTAYFDFIWMSFLLLGPMLILGLLLSGLIHVFISREAILRWLQGDSLRSVFHQLRRGRAGAPLQLLRRSRRRRNAP